MMIDPADIIADFDIEIDGERQVGHILRLIDEDDDDVAWADDAVAFIGYVVSGSRAGEVTTVAIDDPRWEQRRLH